MWSSYATSLLFASRMQTKRLAAYGSVVNAILNERNIILARIVLVIKIYSRLKNYEVTCKF